MVVEGARTGGQAEDGVGGEEEEGGDLHGGKAARRDVKWCLERMRSWPGGDEDGCWCYGVAFEGFG